jgi:hypothetical protein
VSEPAEVVEEEKPKKRVPTFKKAKQGIRQMRQQVDAAADTETPIEQIADFGDPRLTAMWERVHRYAERSDFCSEFDRAMGALGIPPRPVQSYWDATVPVVVEVTGEHEVVEVQLRVYGYEGDLENAKRNYRSVFGRPFNDVVGELAEAKATQWRLDAFKATLGVKAKPQRKAV